MLRSGVSHTPSFQEAAEMLLQPQLGHSGLSETGLDTTVTAGTAGGHWDQRPGGAWHRSLSDVFTLLRCELTGEPSLCAFLREMRRSKAMLFLLDTGLCSGVQRE